MRSSTETDLAGAADNLAALRAMDRDGHLLARLREAFERTLARQQPRLQAARQQQPDRAALAEAMHVLKSAAVQLGGTELLQSCARLEQCSDLELPACLTDFDERLADFRATLAHWT